MLVLSDRTVDAGRVALPMLRVMSRLHDAIVRAGFRHKVGLVADTGVWDVHHCALLVAVGADAVCPWLGCLTAGARERRVPEGLRPGFIEAMSMIGVTPASAYCGAKLIEAVGLDPSFVAHEFPGVPTHLGGIGADVIDRRVAGVPPRAFSPDTRGRRRGGVPLPQRRAPPLQQPRRGPRAARGAGLRKAREEPTAGAGAGYDAFAPASTQREPITVLDLVQLRPGGRSRSSRWSPRSSSSGASWCPA